MPSQRLSLKKKSRKDPPATPALSGILDNRENGKVGDFLREKITPDAEVRVVSAYFSIYAHQALRGELDKAGTFRFLFGDPRSVGNVDPAPAVKQFLIQDGELGSPKTIPCGKNMSHNNAKKWVDSGKVHIQTMANKNDFLHGKMFHILPQDESPPRRRLRQFQFHFPRAGIRARKPRTQHRCRSRHRR